MTELEQAQTEMAKTKGKLLTSEQVDAFDEERDQIWLDEVQSFIDFAATLVPPEKSVATRTAAAEWVRSTRERVADRLESHT